MEPITRRRLLRGCGVGVAVGVAGCSGRGGDGTEPDALSGNVRPSGEPASIPDPLHCEREGAERFDSWYDSVVWGGPAENGDPFALRIERHEYRRGDEATVTLTNTGNEKEMTGNRRKFGFEVRTDPGWQDVRVHSAEDPVAYTDIGILHEPGKGFEWTLPLDATEFTGGTDDRFTVCPGLPAGRYRFVYWGADPALAVAFDLVAGETDTATPRSRAPHTL
ncbi:hypothetical protein [Halorientalis persicus]|nr:hypothetical protein [Halorientalis persicus]